MTITHAANNCARLSSMNDTMAARLKRLREEAGIGQAEVSAATGIERTLVSKMENKGNVTDWYKMCALADLYGVSLDYLRHGQTVPSLEGSGEIIKDADERSLLRMWRAMNEGERLALRAVAERLAEKADPSRTG